MHSRKLLSLFSAILLGGTLQAQDIHFTQFNMNPTTLNPALSGKFEGTLRLSGIYRDQYGSVINDKDVQPAIRNKQFKTPAAGVDAPLIRGFRKKDWVGASLGFFSDKVGQGELTHSSFNLGAAYHLALDKKGNAVLSIGAQYGRGQRGVNPENLRFEDGYGKDGIYIPNLSKESLTNGSGEDITVSYTGINAGALLSSRLNKQMDFNLGFSMSHLNQPKAGLVDAGGGGTTPGMGGNTGGSSKLPSRISVHGQFNMQLQPRFSLSPSFLFQKMSGNQEIILQGLANYLFNPEKEITLSFGVGYRMRDAIHPIVGGKYKNLTVGLAYDVNISGLSQASNFRGGFELAANYIIKIYKPAVVKPKVLCPRF